MARTTTSLLDGVAQAIAAAGIATYHPDGSPYATTDTGIVFKAATPSPDRILVLRFYGPGNLDEVADNRSTFGVQIWGRGTTDPRDVDDLMDDVFDLLHGATNRAFGDVHAIQVNRVSSLDMGQDDNKRWARTDNYYFACDVPATTNRPDGGWD